MIVGEFTTWPSHKQNPWNLMVICRNIPVCEKKWLFSGGSKRGTLPLRNKIFLIHAVFGKICMLAPSHGGLAPPPTGNPGSAPAFMDVDPLTCINSPLVQRLPTSLHLAKQPILFGPLFFKHWWERNSCHGMREKGSTHRPESWHLSARSSSTSSTRSSCRTTNSSGKGSLPAMQTFCRDKNRNSIYVYISCNTDDQIWWIRLNPRVDLSRTPPSAVLRILHLCADVILRRKTSKPLNGLK